MGDYPEWEQFSYAEDHVVFPENMGAYLSIDETSLWQGELYTILTNKEAKGRKGCLIAMVKGTNSQRVKSLLMRKIPLAKRRAVKEVTLDVAASMEEIARKTFTKATLVTDGFHVQKLAYDAVQQMRIEYRWQAIEQENKEMELSKELGKAFITDKLENGNSRKQLLARSRYLLFKRKDLWASAQRYLAEVLFRLCPALEQAYELSQQLGYTTE